MRRNFFLVLASLASLAVQSAFAIEKWADDKLPVKDGVWLWLDATKQIAAWESHEKGLNSGDAADVFYDASGNHRDFVQTLHDAQPKFLTQSSHAALRFDGKDDHLQFRGAAASLENLTVFIFMTPRSNTGGFRALLAASEIGKNDYATGFNIDFGPQPAKDTFNVGVINFEGRGFVGVQNFAKGWVAFEDFHLVTFTCTAGRPGVAGFIDGQPGPTRDRAPGKLRVDQMLLGARCFSNEDAPPFAQGFLDGDIAEVLVYDRILSAEERAAVESYLKQKHEGAAESLTRASATGEQLVRVKNPPDVQMFVPGFVARRLPLDLTNINNLRYRDDGKLIAVGYDGRIWILTDTDKDGLEDKADLFFDGREKITAPIGCALTPPNYPHGRGLFVANKGKLSLIVDTDNDDTGDKEIVCATGWPLTFQPVDTLGVAIAPDNSIYFGLGTTNFASAYLTDDQGKAHYDLKSERGTIMRVAPDLKSHEIVCTGIRFPVGLAFNHLGDLFCTDQEGATWLANGNPFDELLHIQPGRHYGFPPRHPKHLPNVIDEPSDFDYGPQHQSTCGLCFNPHTGPAFGPDHWRDDAIVCGESRGKLYLTKLTKTPAGYVTRNRQIASLPTLLIDSCVTPTGDLVVTSHSGNPDWGTGPAGKGNLFKITYKDKEAPQPVVAYAAGSGEVRIAFDRPLDPAAVAQWSKKLAIDFGPYVGAGDRFEVIRPGYMIVKRQERAPRHKLTVGGAQITPDHRTIVISTSSQRDAVNYALTLDQLDLCYDLTGVLAEWKSDDGKKSWSGWLPHPDLDVAREFTKGSAEHEALWPLLKTPGTLALRGQLDLRNMLQPAVQPGSQLDYTPAQEVVTITFDGAVQKALTFEPKSGELIPFELTIPTGSDTTLHVSFTTNADKRARPLQLRRFLMPWARLPSESETDLGKAEPIPQLSGGDWLRGRELFFGNNAGCAKCHSVRGRGSDMAPDLSNLIHRDYESVMRDIANPSGALNPDYIASTVKLNDGRVLNGLIRNTDADHFLVRGDLDGEKAPIARSAVKKLIPSPISLMPTGLAEGLGTEKMRDLLTFLLTEPLTPAPIERKGAPPPRKRGEVEALLKDIKPTASTKPLNILLVAGAKDHGPSEHDYPAWQKRWTTLLGLAENVKVAQATDWPTPQQWNDANVVAFYCANSAWKNAKGPDLDAFLARGGGLVFIHMAVSGGADSDALANRIGLAWRGGASLFRHGALDLNIDASHPITRGFATSVHFTDESYWNLLGDDKSIKVLATGVEQGAPRPLMWTREQGKGRVFVSIPGHYTWTFDDPLFRVLLLRGIAWSAHEDADRLIHLATIGARIR